MKPKLIKKPVLPYLKNPPNCSLRSKRSLEKVQILSPQPSGVMFDSNINLREVLTSKASAGPKLKTKKSPVKVPTALQDYPKSHYQSSVFTETSYPQSGSHIVKERMRASQNMNLIYQTLEEIL